jgi:hypothetical protein
MPALAQTRLAPRAKPDVLYVKFKTDSVLTISRQRFDVLTDHFGQDATFVAHYALARLYEEVQKGVLNAPSSLTSHIPIGTRPPTEQEWDMLADKSNQAMKGRKFKPTQTLESAWGIA